MKPSRSVLTSVFQVFFCMPACAPASCPESDVCTATRAPRSISQLNLFTTESYLIVFLDFTFSPRSNRTTYFWFIMCLSAKYSVKIMASAKIHGRIRGLSSDATKLKIVSFIYSSFFSLSHWTVCYVHGHFVLL